MMSRVVVPFESKGLTKTLRLSVEPSAELGELLAALTPEQKLSQSAIKLCSDSAFYFHGKGKTKREQEDQDLIQVRKEVLLNNRTRFPLSTVFDEERATHSTKDFVTMPGLRIKIGAYVGDKTGLSRLLRIRTLATATGEIPLSYKVPEYTEVDVDAFQELASRLRFSTVRNREILRDESLYVTNIETVEESYSP